MATSNEDLLTKDELEALMEGVGAGRAGAGGAWERQEEVSAYNLVSPENQVTSILPVLDSIHERFCHQVWVGLFDLMRREPEIVPVAIEVRSYRDFLASMTVPCSINIVTLSPLKGLAMLLFEQPLVFLVVDRFFGGPGRQYTPSTGREFTATENRLIQRMLRMVFEGLREAWDPYLKIQCSKVAAETNPNLVATFDPNETLVVGSVKVALDEVKSALHLALPCTMFEPVRQTLLHRGTPVQPPPDPKSLKMLGDRIRDTSVDARCVLDEMELTLGELLSLKVGDVISHDFPAQARLLVEDVPFFNGSYGIAQGKRAMKIKRCLVHTQEAGFSTESGSTS